MAARFDADAADTGGLLSKLARQRLSIREGRAILVGIGLAMTLGGSVFDLISQASRASAIYYGLEFLFAAIGLGRSIRRPPLTFTFAFAVEALSVVVFLVAVFGVTVEQRADLPAFYGQPYGLSVSQISFPLLFCCGGNDRARKHDRKHCHANNIN